MAGLMERRNWTRYPLELPVRFWPAKSPKRAAPIGTGKTINISSRGLSFTTEEALESGVLLRLELVWPVRLHDEHPIKLSFNGTVVRSTDGLTAVTFVRYEFRMMKLTA